MSLEENKALAARFIQAWTAGGQGVVDDLAAPDLVVYYSHFPQPVHGRKMFQELLALTFSRLPDMRMTAHEFIAEADRVVVRWTYTATQTVEVFGYRPTGRQVEVSGITIYRIRDGQVIEEIGVVDNLSLLRQIGAFPASGVAAQPAS